MRGWRQLPAFFTLAEGDREPIENATARYCILGWVNFSEFEIPVCGSCKMSTIKFFTAKYFLSNFWLHIFKSVGNRKLANIRKSMQIRKPVVPKKILKGFFIFLVKWVYHKLYIFQFHILIQIDPALWTTFLSPEITQLCPDRKRVKCKLFWANLLSPIHTAISQAWF